MTNNIKKRVGFGALFVSMGAAVQWRLWILWIVAMALPTAIVAMPLHSMLGGLLDHSVNTAAWAKSFHALGMGDALFKLLPGGGGSALAGANAAALIVTLLLSPFLTGMVVTAARAPRHPGFGELMHGGLIEYWRLVRIMLWGILPFVVALIIGSLVSHWASTRADAAVLQSVADRGNTIAKIVMIVLLVLAHAMLESGRAQLAADPLLRSSTRAFFRGVGMLVRRPVGTLGLYLIISIVGYVLVLLVGMWRIRTDAAGVFGFLLALLLAQLIVLLLTWQRTARLFALTAVARATPPRRSVGNATLAPA